VAIAGTTTLCQMAEAVEIYYHDLRTEFLERSSTWMGVHQRAGIDTAISVVVIHYFLISL
jgi:hypothetical protein